MDDKNRTLLAILLSVAIIMVYTQLVLAPNSKRSATPAPTPLPAYPVSQVTSGNPAAANTASQSLGAPSSQASAIAATVQTHPSSAEISAAPHTIVVTDKFSIDITHLGGRLRSATLNGYALHPKSEALYDLVVSSDGAPLPLALVTSTWSDDYVMYTLEAVTGAFEQSGNRLVLKTSGDGSVVLKGKLPSGATVTKTFHFLPQTYLVSLDISSDAIAPDNSPLWLEWAHSVSKDDPEARLQQRHITVMSADEKVKHTPVEKVVAPITELGNARWITFADKYFMATVIGGAEQSGAARVGLEGHTYLSRLATSPRGGAYKLYLGPKDYTALAQVGFQLEKNIDLGMFTFLARPILGGIRWLYALLGNYGLAIIAGTIILKLAFLPLTKASYESMQKMSVIQPEIKALRERIKDASQLNQEVMALYKRHGVNPAQGCLPILIQIPVFLGLYNALLNALEMRHAPFALWIQDLSSPERLLIFGIPIPLMILLMGASMFYQQYTTPSAMDASQRRIFLAMPIMFTVSFIIFPMPSGLTLYWLVNNLISIVQQVSLRSARISSPYRVTALAGLAIFGFGYVLHLF